MKTIFYLVSFCLLGLNSTSQAVFNTFGSGNWNNIGTWNIVSGTDADNIPDLDDDVTILDGHTVTITSVQNVADLTLQGTSGTRLIVNGATLNINGKLSGPSANFSNEILQTDGTGLIKFIGGARALFGTWSLGSNSAAWLWRMEVALNSGAIGTANAVRASYIRVSSGIFNASDIKVDSTFSDGTGVIQIDAGATIRFATAIGTRLVYYNPSYCRSIIVNGTLESTGQGYIAASNVVINGRLILKGYSKIVSYPSGTGVAEFVYGPGSALEYSNPNGEMFVGDEIDRSTLANNIVDTIVVNVGNNYSVTDVKIEQDTLSVNNLRFGTYGKLLIATGRVILSPNAAVINASKDRFIVTLGGDVVAKQVGNTQVFVPVGPSMTEYNPVYLSNTGTVDDFIVKAMLSRPQCLGPYPLTSVNYQWAISEATPGGSNMTLGLGYSDIIKRGSMYVPANAQVIHCTGATLDKHSGSGESGGDPFVVTGAGFNSFSVFGITSDATALPLTFMRSFTARASSEGVVLAWTVNCTAQKVTMEVQNATGNTNNFTTVGTVEASADRCREPFEFIHTSAVQNENYYRIKISDIDGSVSYSTIVHVPAVVSETTVTLMANPVQGSAAQLRIVSKDATRLMLRLSDSQGRELLTENYLAGRGSGLLRMDIGSLSPGIYFLRVFENGKRLTTIKVVKE